jgi:tetratricopeptide (TPR) repeat protein
MNLRRLAFALPLALLAGCRAAPQGSEHPGDVNHLVMHGDYGPAVELAEREARENPRDEAAAERYRLASVALLLEQARRACFEDRDEFALEKVRAALAIAPDLEVVQNWSEKLLTKLADRHIDEAREWYAQYNLEAARQSYEKALNYRPENAHAQASLAMVLIQLNYRAGMGEKYYQEGVGLLRDAWLEQARSRFDYTRKYKENERAKSRGAQVRRQLAEARTTIALDLERSGLFAAARNEFRIALLLWKDLPEATEGLERTKLEELAANLLREAEMLRLRGRFDDAEERVAQAQTLGAQQAETVEGAKAGIEESRLEQLYDKALALESDQQFEEAVALYGKLLEKSSYFKDAIARKETLESYIAKANTLYAQAQAATVQDEKVRLLQQIAIFWPEYKDVQQLLELLAPPKPPIR